MRDGQDDLADIPALIENVVRFFGALTHVLVASPTEGYGIFIENMLNAAQSQVQPKAA